VSPVSSPIADRGAPDARLPSLFWPAFWMGAVLFVAKAQFWSRPAWTRRALTDYATDLAASSYADLAFTAGAALLAALAIASLRRWPRAPRLVYASFLWFATLAVLYAVVSARVFEYLISPVTWPLLDVARDLTAMRPSLGPFVNAKVAAALVTAPLLYRLAVHACRAAHPWTHRRAAVGWTLLAAWIAFGHHVASGEWGSRFEQWISASPHWTLLASTARGLWHPDTPRLTSDFDAGDLEDFAVPSPQLRTLPSMPGEAAIRPRNVILLVLESTSAEWMSLYGSRYPTTPRLQSEAGHALVFDNFYCHAVISANSMAALTLSVYPYMTTREYTAEYPEMPGATLADMLKAQGYRTAFIHSGEVEYMGQDRFLSHRGFDQVWGSRQLGAAAVSEWGASDHVLVDGIFKWLDANRAQPFYVMAWTIESHFPYEADPSHEEIEFFHGDEPSDAWDMGRYLNTIEDVDRQIGRLIDGLRERGLADDTLLVITGDHGEGFGVPHYSWGHGDRVWQENVRVPLVFWNPRLFPTGRRSSIVGGHVDVNPTVMALLGVPPHVSWQGRSLFDPDRPPRTYFYAARDGYLFGVRDGDWKYILDTTRGRDELYDLSRDPTEQHDLSGVQPERSRGLRRRLAAWRHHVAATTRALRERQPPAAQAAASP
jgi:arylsulfatase A-like enzyme